MTTNRSREVKIPYSLRAGADVLAATPLFLSAPLFRKWHMRWGATDAEVAAVMPGDDLEPKATVRATRAITIAAPPEAVWPWIVQIGFGRAGFYSYDLLDSLGRPSAEVIPVPADQMFYVEGDGTGIPVRPE